MFEITPCANQACEVIARIESLGQPYPWSLEQLASCFGCGYHNALARDGQDPVGFYIAHEVAAEMTLLNICIAPSWRRKGYGKRLMQHLLLQAHRLNVETLWLEVRNSNQAAQELYVSLGFVVQGVRKAYYPSDDGREDALVMRLDINH